MKSHLDRAGKAMMTRFTVLHLFALILPWASADGQETATYELTIDVTWSAETHPLDFPSNPTFSHLVGATHNDRYAMFRDGETGSSGLELIAERGRVSIFLIELEEADDRELIGTVFDGDENRRDTWYDNLVLLSDGGLSAVVVRDDDRA